MKHILDGFAIKTRGVDADAVAARLAELCDRHDGLTAEIVLRDAEDESSPLHPAFEWDDTEAAKHWRMHQARNLIRQVRVVREDVIGSHPTPVFVRTDDVYRPVSQVVTRADWYEQALANLRSKVDQAEAAARDLIRAAREHPKPDDRMIAKAERIEAAIQPLVEAVS